MLAHGKHTMCARERNETSALLIFQLKPRGLKRESTSQPARPGLKFPNQSVWSQAPAAAHSPAHACEIACVYPAFSHIAYSHVYQFCVELCRRLAIPSTPSSTVGERRHLSLVAISPLTLHPLPTRSSNRSLSVTPL